MQIRFFLIVLFWMVYTLDADLRMESFWCVQIQTEKRKRFAICPDESSDSGRMTGKSWAYSANHSKNCSFRYANS